MNLSLIFITLSLVCFLFATVNWPNSPRVNMVALGLALYVASLLVTGTLRTP